MRELLRRVDWWPQWEYLQRYGSWDPLVPEPYEECEAGGGPITTSTPTACSRSPSTPFRQSTKWKRSIGQVCGNDAACPPHPATQQWSALDGPLTAVSEGALEHFAGVRPAGSSHCNLRP